MAPFFFSGAFGTPYQNPAARTVFDFAGLPSCSDPGVAGAFVVAGAFGEAGAFGAGGAFGAVGAWGADCSASRSAEIASDAGRAKEGIRGV
jgi:hypothetical protein